MRKLLTIILIGVIGLNVALAQNSAVNKAESLIKEGKFAEAKEQITPALEHEKTVDKGKTWYINGLLYMGIFNSDDPDVQALDDDPVKKATDSFLKVKTMEKEGNAFYTFSDLNLEAMWSTLINKGAAEYKIADSLGKIDQADEAVGNFKKALEYLNQSKIIKPNDTTSLLYTGVIAQMAGENEMAIENYRALMNLGHYDPDIFGSIIQIQRVGMKDTLAALATTREAIEHFPDDKEFKRLELELLLSMNMLDDARQKLIEQIAENPADPVLYFSLGYMYDETKDLDKAAENYRKATELKPDYFEATVNLAIIYYNQAILTFNELNNLPMDQYKKKGTSLQEKGKEQMRQSLPYWEAGAKIKPNDTLVLESLMNVYVRLGMNAKAEEVAKKLDELEK